jgi:hypothetical protein
VTRYVVQKPVWLPVWLPDTRRAPANIVLQDVERGVGDVVDLTEDQARYFVLSGSLALESESTPTPPSPYVSTDVIILKRDGAYRVLRPSEVAAYVAPLVGTTTPVDPPTAGTEDPGSLDYSQPGNPLIPGLTT